MKLEQGAEEQGAEEQGAKEQGAKEQGVKEEGAKEPASAATESNESTQSQLAATPISAAIPVVTCSIITDVPATTFYPNKIKSGGMEGTKGRPRNQGKLTKELVKHNTEDAHSPTIIQEEDLIKFTPITSSDTIADVYADAHVEKFHKTKHNYTQSAVIDVEKMTTTKYNSSKEYLKTKATTLPTSPLHKSHTDEDDEDVPTESIYTPKKSNAISKKKRKRRRPASPALSNGKERENKSSCRRVPKKTKSSLPDDACPPPNSKPIRGRKRRRPGRLSNMSQEDELSVSKVVLNPTMASLSDSTLRLPSNRIRTESHLKRDADFVLDLSISDDGGSQKYQRRREQQQSSDSVSYSLSELEANSETDEDTSQRGKTERPLEDGNVNQCAECGYTGDLICCDTCPRAFHEACLPIDKSSIPDSWSCHHCEREKKPDPKEDFVTGEGVEDEIRCLFYEWEDDADTKYFTIIARIYEMIEKLVNYSFGEMFAKPVDPAFTEYYMSVSRPMDLGTIKEKVLNQSGYSTRRNLRLFDVVLNALEDVQLVWKNCHFFNQKGSSIYRMASVQQRKYQHLMHMSVLPLLTSEEVERVKPFL